RPSDRPARASAGPFPSRAARSLPRHPGLTRRLRAALARVCPDPDDDCLPGSPPSPQAEDFLDHRFVRLVYEAPERNVGIGKGWKSAARGGGGQGLIGWVT